MIRIYIGDKHLAVTDSIDKAHQMRDDGAIFGDDPATVRTVIKELENSAQQSAVLLYKSVEAAMSIVKSELKLVQAAGGLVYTPEKEVLLIFRKGKWDLPKGKLDKGEDLETCALREIEEETGAKYLSIHQPLITTYHTYKEKNKQILKESHWYLVKADQKSELQPQLDEDIVESKWVPLTEVEIHKSNMHASVKDVIDTGLPILKAMA